MSPHVPEPHGATSRHTVSPVAAMSPGAHGSFGKMGSQPRSPSCTKPAPQPSGGTPAGMHTPSSRNHSPGGQGMSGGRPAGTHAPSSLRHSPAAHVPGGSAGEDSSSALLQPSIKS